VDVFVRKLRSKLQKHSPGWSYIHTHFGVGYRFEPDPGAPAEAELPAAAPDQITATEAADNAPVRQAG
jgi:DNA-binding winged helix-turn-helix (wHTH) protein